MRRVIISMTDVSAAQYVPDGRILRPELANRAD
jgi:hypothetical protein